MSLLVVVRGDSRAEALLRWASCFADGNCDQLYVLDCRESEHETTSEWKKIGNDGFPKVSYKDLLVELDAEDRMEIHYLSVKSPDAYSTIMAEQEKLKPKLLLLDRNLIADSPFEVQYIERLLNDVHCAVMVLRLGGTDGSNGKVLIPAAGGPNSKYALRLVNSSAAIQATAFFVEPDADEVSKEVGEARLKKILRSSGVKKGLEKKIVISNQVSRSIADEVDQGDYGMLLVGATDAGTLRRKLFGTVSEKVLREKDGTAVGVIRAEKPLGHKIRDRIERFLHLRTPQLKREVRIALFAEIEDKSLWSFDFAVLMVLATSIAALGLLADSGAVVIGAMLVAPLMTPLLGGGLALVQGNWPLWKRCQTSVLLGFLFALVIGMIAGLVANVCGIFLTGELAARGKPTALDLGVAFASGLAASYCFARPKLSGALAGVAISAALVPPIATTGICLVMGELEVARGAALLFGTNVVAIVFGSGLNFYIAGIRGRSGASGVWSKRLFIVLALVCMGLAVPLTSSLIGKFAVSENMLQVVNKEMEGELRVISISPAGHDAKGRLKLAVETEAGQTLTDLQYHQLEIVISQHYKSEITLQVRTTLVRGWH